MSPESKRAGWQADPIRVAPLSVPDIATEADNLQAKHLAKVFFLPPATAIAIANLAYGRGGVDG